jgi:UPF0755 protein
MSLDPLKKARLLAALTLATTALVGSLFYFATRAPGGSSPVIVEVAPGSGLKQVASRLAEQGLIKSTRAFQALAYLKRVQNQIQVGEFELTPAMSAGEVLSRLTRGHSIQHAITIPEGHRITEIAAALEAKGLADRTSFLHLTQDPEVIDSYSLDVTSLEGYLFPETYHFSKFTSERTILNVMVATFKERVMQPEVLDRTRAMGLTLHQAVTLASLIEKETGVDEERPLISSVFHNRLKIDMKLQTDPTVIYALEDFDGNLRKKDLGIDSPYNTYRYPGLPPGPIANPGLKSILAALSPAESDYLFFVSRQDGSHQFSTNLPDHNRAVMKYQLKKIRRG